MGLDTSLVEGVVSLKDSACFQRKHLLWSERFLYMGKCNLE